MLCACGSLFLCVLLVYVVALWMLDRIDRARMDRTCIFLPPGWPCARASYEVHDDWGVRLARAVLICAQNDFRVSVLRVCPVLG